MGIITQEVEATWTPSNRIWYESKGYVFTRFKEKFIASVNDLSIGCRLKVEYICDNCGQIAKVEWKQYNSGIKSDGKKYCHKCSHQLFGAEKIRKTLLNNGVSFEQWCINNNREDILNLWDYELNKYKPNEISYNTKIKCWFKCPLGIHSSEIKHIQVITRNKNKANNICNQCNSFGQWLINNYGDNVIEFYWSNKNTISPFEIAYHSGKNVWLICENCKNEKLIAPHTFTRYGIMCNKCSDGFSYPNKFAFSLLEQLGLDFITEYSPEWIKPYRYDFYFEKDNKKFILEMDGGLGHGNKIHNKSKLTIEETLEIDKLKDEFAQENNITVIRVNCCYGMNNKFKYITNEILNSRELNKYFDLSTVNWEECHKNACNSLIKKACDLYSLYNSNIDVITRISSEINVTEQTAIRYLKQGSEIGLCDYGSKKSNKTPSIINKC